VIAASFASTCTCGCGRAYPEGAAIEKTRTGWVLESCLDPRPAALAASRSPFAGPAEILEILGRARARDALATAADRIRATRAGGGLF
jgi:hypothetical protein